jgi:hypothetical protein
VRMPEPDGDRIARPAIPPLPQDAQVPLLNNHGPGGILPPARGPAAGQRLLHLHGEVPPVEGGGLGRVADQVPPAST